MMKAVFVVLALVAVAFGEPTQVIRCRSGGQLPLQAYVEGCVTPPCRLAQQSTANMEVVFETISDTSELWAQATAFLRVGFIEIPIPYDLGEQRDGCKHSNATCPVSAGTTVQYKFAMFIEPFFPVNTAVNVEFSMNDQFCMRVPIVIVAPHVATIDGEVDIQQ